MTGCLDLFRRSLSLFLNAGQSMLNMSLPARDLFLTTDLFLLRLDPLRLPVYFNSLV